MIDFLRGPVIHTTSEFCILEVNGIGYRLSISKNTRESLHVGSESTLYVYMQIREDEINLFGFSDFEERKVFEYVKSVSGIGPKIALSFVNTLSISEFYSVIVNKNLERIAEVPGIGKKTAEKIHLELKDKINSVPITSINDEISVQKKADTRHEVKLALKELGYSDREIDLALVEVDSSLSVDDTLRNTLKILATL